jgi:hypothetical protein
MLHNMERAGRIPKLPKGSVRPTLVTGLEALSRGKDGATLTSYLMELSRVFGPDWLAANINPNDAARRLGTSYQIDTKGLVRTEEEVAATQQAQAQQAMLASVVDKGTGPAIAAAAQANQQG